MVAALDVKRTRGPDKAPRAAPGANPTATRFPNHAIKHPDQVMKLASDHPAMVEGRTLFPNMVMSAADVPRVLVGGENHRKLGKSVTVGPWKGFPIFALTLQERDTCPTTCHLLAACYGNGMSLARRVAHGRDLEYRLATELAALQDLHPAGFVVRLHVLGDFTDLAYVGLWRRWMLQFPALHVFGYTAWPFPVGDVAWRAGCAIDERQQLAAMIDQTNLDYPDRWVIRFSTPRPVAGLHGQATTIARVPEAAKVPEGYVCPAETGKTKNCGTCGLCWHPKMTDTPIVFVMHGRKAAALVSTQAPAALSRTGKQKFIGVLLTLKGQYRARAVIDGSLRELGHFATPVEAARAYDAVVAPLGRRINFPNEHHTPQRSAPSEQADAVATDASVTDSGVQAGRDESLSARPAVISRLIGADAPPAAKPTRVPDVGQTPTHTPELTTSAPSGSVSKSGQGAAVSKGDARPESRTASVNKPPSRTIFQDETVATPGEAQARTEADRLMAKRPARSVGAARADEEAQIAAFLAERGARVCPPVGPCAPGREAAQTKAIADARELLISEAQYLPGMRVTYTVGWGSTRYSAHAVVSDKPSVHPNRVAVDVVTGAGVTETKQIFRSQITARK